MFKDRHHSEESRKKISQALKRKGIKPPSNKGKHFSSEHRRKLSEYRKGTHLSEETKKKIGEHSARVWLGKHLPEETKRKISKEMKGSKNHNFGKHLSEETKRKLSESHKGAKNSSWKGGMTPENRRIRNSFESNLWRKSVLQRDNLTCQKCGQFGGRLVIHHINNFAEFPELRFIAENGITLCDKCHREFHKKYGEHNNTKEQLENFIK